VKSRRRMRRSSLLLVATCLLVGAMLPTRSASAQAGRTPEAEQACTPDVMRLCADFIPNVRPIVACLHRKRLQLSHQCRRYIKPGKGRRKT
jgi:hypothetical protein